MRKKTLKVDIIIVIVLILIFAAIITALVLPNVSEDSGDHEYMSVNEVADKNIGVMLGSVYEHIIGNNMPKANLSFFDNASDMALAVSTGKIDAFACSQVQAESIIKENADLKILTGSPGTIDVAFAFPKTDGGAKLRDEFNVYLAEVTADGTLAEYKDKWLKGSGDPDIEDRTLTGTNGTLKMATTGTTEPYTYIENDRNVGLDVELAYGFCRKYGYGLEIHVMDFSAMIPALHSSTYDFAGANITITDERAESVWFSDRYNQNKVAVVVAGKGSKALTVSDYNGKRIGIMTGSNFEQPTMEYFPDSTYLYYDNISDLILALQQNKIDGFVHDEPVLRLTCAEYPDVGYFKDCLRNDTYCFGFRKGDERSEKLRTQFNEMLAELESDGTLAEMKRKWFSGGVSTLDIDKSGITGENGTINIAVNPTNVPFALINSEGLSGYSVELVTMFCRRYGYDCRYDQVNTASGLAGLTSGVYDIFANNTTTTPEREESISFSDPIYYGGISLAVRASELESADQGAPSVSDYIGKKIGIVTGTNYEEPTLKYLPDSEYLYYNNTSDISVALTQNKIDGFLCDEPLLRVLSREKPDISYLPDMVTHDQYAFAFRKNDERSDHIRGQFNEMLADLESDGSLEKIKEKWIGTNESEKVIDLSGYSGENGTLNVVINSTALPFAYMKDNNMVGIAVELMDMFCRRYGYTPHIEDADFTAHIPGLVSGKYDMVVSAMTITEERKESVNFSDSFYKGGLAFAVRTSDLNKDTSSDTVTRDTPISYFADKKIGILTGSSYEMVAEEILPDAEYVYMDVSSDLALAATTGKIDGFLMSADKANTMIAENPSLFCLKEEAGKSPIAFAFPKTDKGAELRDKVNTFFKIIKADGTMDDLLVKWPGDSSEQAVDLTGFTGENGVLKIACDGTTPPWEFTYNGALTGYEIELAAMFCREYGYTPVFDTMNFSAVIPGISSGKYDLAAADISVTKESAESVYFSDPELENTVVLVTVRNNTGSGSATPAVTFDMLNSPEYTIGSGTGSSGMFAVEEAFPDANKLHFDNHITGYEAVRLGKIDAYVHEKVQMQLAIDNGLEGVVLLPDSIGSKTDIVVGLSRKSRIPDLKEKINTFLSEIRGDGTINEIYDRWVHDRDYTMPEIYSDNTSGLTLHVGTTGNVEPYSFFIGNELTGMDIELAKRFASWLGADLVIDVFDFSGAISAAESGNIDCIFSDLHATEERRETIDFSDTVYISENAVMVADKNYTPPDNASWIDGIISSFEKNFIREDRWKLILEGIGTTCLITVLSTLFGSLLAFLVCMFRRTGSRLANAISNIYVKILQGTPMVVLLMILYYVIFGKSGLDAVWVAVIGFTINFGAYASEIMRSGIESIDGGQREAALALGYSENQAFFKFIFPQASVRFLPVYKQEIISLLKSTSIVGYIAIQDLTKMSDIIRSRTYEAFFPLIVTALIYFILAWIITIILKLILNSIDFRRRKRGSAK